MTAFVDYITPETIASIRAKMKGYAEAALLIVSDWIPGAVSQQVLEAVDQALYNVAQVTSSLVRGYASLDTSTDPGDVDPYDPTNAALAPAPGYLSAKAEGDYGTPRLTNTFALGTVTLANGSAGAVTFSVGALTFTSSGTNPTTGAHPTYRNIDGGPTYTKPGGGTIAANPDGSLTVAAGLSVFVPVQAEEIGTGSNAGGGLLSLATVLAIGVTATNAASVLGTDRQSAEDCRTAAREAGALTSPNGPADSYRYLATTARSDGTYGKSTTGTPIGVTGVYVSQEAIAGDVDIYIRGAAGGAALGAPNRAIVDAIIRTTPGVIACPDAISISVSLATDVTIAVTFSVKGKASAVPGAAAATYTKVGSSPSSPDATADAVFAAIDAALVDYLASVEIGGVDQTAGAGVIYTTDIQDAIPGAWPSLYKPSVTAPGGASTAIALGHDGILGAVNRTLVLV